MRRRQKISELLTPSQESVYRFLGKSTRWLTLYQISKLTGVSMNNTRAAVNELRKMDLLEVRTCRVGFDNGEREFKATGTIAESVIDRLNTHRLFGVETLVQKIARFVGVDKAREIEKILK